MPANYEEIAQGFEEGGAAVPGMPMLGDPPAVVGNQGGTVDPSKDQDYVPIPRVIPTPAEVSAGATPSKPVRSEMGTTDYEAIATSREGGGAPVPPDQEAISTSETGADVTDIAVASLANDPQARIRYFARQRGIPENRYRIIDGEIAYQGDDGRFYKEVPDISLADPVTIAQGVATGVGPSFPAVPGAAAGILTAPAALTGPPGLALSLSATGGAAAGGQAVREGLANYLMDQDVSPGRIALEGGSAAAGQGIGAGLSTFAQRNLARDIGQLAPRAVRETERAAAAEGIPLTPAEKTGLPSLKAQQKALGNLPSSADKMEKFYSDRAGQVKVAIQRFLDRISPVDSAEVTGDMARAASRGAMSTVAKNRATQARPLYKRAFESNPDVDVDSVITRIDTELATAKGGIKTALERARALLFREVDDFADDGTKITKLVPEDRLDALHQAKLALDDMIDNFADSGIGKTGRGRIRTIKNQLLEEMDAASPDYQSARAIFADLSPGNTRVAEGLVGKVAKLTERQVKDAARIFLGPASGPRAIREARRLIEKENPDAWQAIKRSFMQDLFEKAQKEGVTGTANVAGQFRKAVIGNPQQAARIKAALSPMEYAGLKQLARALDAASKVKQIGSDTAWNQEAMRMARDKARPLIAKIARNLNPAQALRSFEEWVTERSLAKNASRLADIITSPDGMEKLKELRRLPPNSIRARVLLGHLLTVSGREVVGVGPTDQ